MLLDYLAGEGGLAILDMNPGLVIWTFIAFFIVLFLLSKFAWGPISKALDERAMRIHDDLERAEQLKTEAENKLSEYLEKLDGLRAEGNAIVNEAQEDARKLKDKMLKEAQSEANAIKERALREVELAKDDALAQIHTTVVEVATSVAAKIMSKELSAADHSKLVQDAVKELGSLN